MLYGVLAAYLSYQWGVLTVVYSVLVRTSTQLYPSTTELWIPSSARLRLIGTSCWILSALGVCHWPCAPTAGLERASESSSLYLLRAD